MEDKEGDGSITSKLNLGRLALKMVGELTRSSARFF
jgi:hypothetical protein